MTVITGREVTLLALLVHLYESGLNYLFLLGTVSSYMLKYVVKFLFCAVYLVYVRMESTV